MRIFFAILTLSALTGFGASDPTPTATFDVRKFGATGDGRTVETVAIQTAINRCRDAGGGTVIVSPGIYLTGTLRLFSNVNLTVQPGAVLKGSAALSDYMLDGVKLGLIFVQNAQHVAITGGGTIDGNADEFVDHTRAKAPDRESVRQSRQGEHFRDGAEGVGDGPLEPRERPAQMVLFSNCRDVTVRGVTMANSPYWTLQLIDCDGASLSDLKVQNSLMMPNNNGITLSSSSNVRIANCNIRCGDTALAVFGASHFKRDPGYNNLTHDTENITATNCILESRSVGIHVGGYTHNNVRNCSFDHIIIKDSLRGIKIGVRERGTVEGITFSDISITTRLFRGNWWGNGEPLFIYAYRAEPNTPIGRVRRITFDRVTAEGVSGMLVYGSTESIVENLSFSNFALAIKPSPLNSVSGGNYDLRPSADPAKQIFSHDIPAFHLEHVRDIRLRNFSVTWDDVREPYFTDGIAITEFENVSIDGYVGHGAPYNEAAAALRLENGRGYRVVNSRSAGSPTQFLAARNATPD